MKNRDGPVMLMQAPTSRRYRERMQVSSVAVPPLSLLSLGAVLRSQGRKVHARDCIYSVPSRQELRRLLEELQPRVLGLSMMTINGYGGRDLAALAKAVVPQVVVVAGGPLATFMPEELLRLGVFDYAVIGEGEHTLVEFCDAVYADALEATRHRIAGLAFLEEGKMVRTARRELEPDLDRLPLPDRSLLPVDCYTVPFALETARGCVGHCTFCASRAFWGRCRLKSVERVKEELRVLRRDFAFHDMMIVDDTFTINEPRVRDLCEFLLAEQFNLRWYCNARVDSRLGLECYKLMFRAGCRKVLLGIESGDDEVLQAIGKYITVAQAEETVRTIRQAGLQLGCGFMLGHPGDTLDTIRATVRFAKHLRDAYDAIPKIMMNTPYPGTPQWYDAEGLGLEFERDWNAYANGDVLQRTRLLSATDILELQQGILEGEDALRELMTENTASELAKVPTQKGRTWAES
jgi:radical SAM superfamily enzyme YgiQ (UPF0313 family)